MDRPLTGYRVLDCSEHAAGPMAAMYLADFGADVIKVESPAGDPGRASPGFPLWNRNKRALTCDWRDIAGREQLLTWLAGADAGVFSQPISVLEPLGLAPAQLSARFPALAVLHLPAFLPGAAHDAIPAETPFIAAATGAGLYQSSNDKTVPVDPVIPHLTSMQGIWGAAALVSALFERETSGHGQVVTVSGLQATIICLTSQAGYPLDMPAIKPMGAPAGGLPNYRLYECADGEWLMLAALTPAFRMSALTTLGVLEEFLLDPRIGSELAAIGLPENMGWASEVIQRAVRTRPRAEWLKLIAENGCPTGPVLTREQWLAHPQLDAVGMRVTLDDPSLGKVTMPALPIALSRSPARIERPAPVPGEMPGQSAWAPRPQPGDSRTPVASGPLAGVRVLDLGAIVAGTFGASLLADLGADVIKIEPLTGDNLRNNGLTFHGYNLGKRGLVLDLRHPAGRDAFYRLVRDADVVIDNYRPGVLERLGADYDSIRAVNKDIISVSVTGYGTTGPLGTEPGFDPLLQAASGMMKSQGGDGPPIFYSIPVNDVGSAATAALGALLALLHRKRTGEGQAVSTSLLAQSLMMQCTEAIDYEGRPPRQLGGEDFQGPGPLDRYFATADGFVRLRATASGDAARLAKAGLVPKGCSGGELAAALATSLLASSRDDAAAKLQAAGIPAAPTRALCELPALEGVVDAGLLNRACPGGRDVYIAGKYASFSRTQREGIKLPPGLGEHSLEVLLEVGFTDDEAGQLLAEGVVTQGDPIVF